MLPFLVMVGLFDAGYLAIEHYRNIIPPCSINSIFTDCGQVLRSPYSTIIGIPLALLGFIHYSFLLLFIVRALYRKSNPIYRYLALLQSTFGLIFSIYLVYLQLVVIHAICLYCMISAITSLLIFWGVQIEFVRERKRGAIFAIGYLYQNIVKRILFLGDAQNIHESMTQIGQAGGTVGPAQEVIKYFIYAGTPILKQEIFGISFNHPVGLAAGFDYEARLTQVLAAWGFGFQTIGTITNEAYAGNAYPILGRLPKSRSLLVNKGFKNLGADVTIDNLEDLTFPIPVGVSIGRTNSPKLSTHKASIQDILATFEKFEKSNVQHSYYELNISCPNLFGDINFYSKNNLSELLTEVDKLNIKRPILMKMPIERTDAEVVQMLDVISKHTPKGVIFGNLQKNRDQREFDKTEIANAGVGSFSGKPTSARSNELIRLAYRHFQKRFVIVGCGGIFNGYDAYEKIVAGATLLQLITGMIYQGPQLAAEVNLELENQLRIHGFTHISQAIGSKNDK